MNTIQQLVFMALAVICTAKVSGQSMQMAKYYYEQGKYLEAAKQLRPLADGGNAEAQCMAAMMFFEGKGVQKNATQGVKYATMAADQCNEEAIKLLANHYWSNNPKKAFELLKFYTDNHPYLKQKEIGMMLAECYIRPLGTEQNEELGWQLAEGNEQWDNLIQRGKTAARYYDYMMRKAGKTCIEDYADWLFANGQSAKFQAVCRYIETQQGNVMSYYEKRASEGNAFAQAMLADILYDRNEIGRAREYHRRSLQGGSAYALSIQDKINYTPVSFDINVKFDRLVTFVKVEHRYDKTILHGLYRGLTSDSWKEFAQEAFLITDGQSPKYTMTSTSKRIYGIGNSRPVPFTLEFKPIPQDWSRLYFCYKEQIYMTINK